MANLTNRFRPLKYHALRNATLIILIFIEKTSSIGCFVCQSYNGSDPSCEDTFNSTVQQGTNFSSGKNKYLNPCWAEKLHHRGLFPAEYCIKIKGYQSDNPKSTMVIRTCALDSGTLTADTEIVRISSCSPFKFRGKQYNGCVQSCDTDGCNRATSTEISFSLYLLISALLIYMFCKCNDCTYS
ncbi:unnamed protein product [Enterobius vermicularis]|uniref:Protein quiver n=1 Tax=Enterobius vermicularis TaxID=51028 RepID=A0A0N4VGW2_ENTVE|nr:unnamed protein product [Enterobius vermicularis]